MEKVMEELNEWQFFSELPETMFGFQCEKQLWENDNKYFIFRYYNDELRRSFSIYFDGSTKEFLARIVIGLTEFCDIRYIVANIQSLEAILKEKLEGTLSDLANFNITTIDCILLEKNVIDWSYAHQLPKRVGTFSLFIDPSEPVKIINGSYIILDYSDFVAESNFIIYYNIFRDEFFGELRIKRTPQMTAEFDAKTLSELEEKLKQNLKIALESMTPTDF